MQGAKTECTVVVDFISVIKLKLRDT